MHPRSKGQTKQRKYLRPPMIWDSGAVTAGLVIWQSGAENIFLVYILSDLPDLSALRSGSEQKHVVVVWQLAMGKKTLERKPISEQRIKGAQGGLECGKSQTANSKIQSEGKREMTLSPVGPKKAL